MLHHAKWLQMDLYPEIVKVQRSVDIESVHETQSGLVFSQATALGYKGQRREQSANVHPAVNRP